MSNESDNKEKNMLVGISTSRLINELQNRKLNQGDINILHGLQLSEDEKIRTLNEDALVVKEFVRTISEKNVFGKLGIGAKIDGGEPVNWELAGGFYEHGPNRRLIGYDNEKLIEGLLNRIYTNKDKLPELINRQFVVVDDFPTLEYAIMAIEFFQNSKAVDNRSPYTPAKVLMKIPKETMEKILIAIQSNPDVLEEFYQQAFPGLDSPDEEKSGFKRLKSDGFYLINRPELIQNAKFLFSPNPRNLIEYFKTVPFLKYKRGPYGTGDPLQAK